MRRVRVRQVRSASGHRSDQAATAQAATAQAILAALFAGLVTLVLGILALFAYARFDQRDLNLGSIISTPTPPGDIPPAVVGKLTGKQNNFMAAVFDLAQRGVLEIREQKGFLGTRKYILSRKETGLPLQPQEQGLLQALFKPGEAEIHLEQIATRLQRDHKLFDEPLEQQLIQRGWLDEGRKQKRNSRFVSFAKARGPSKRIPSHSLPMWVGPLGPTCGLKPAPT